MTNLPFYEPLPVRETLDGRPRALGLEIEFSGLHEERAAGIIAAVTGGTARQGDGIVEVETPRFGTCEVYLDTRFRDDVERMAGSGAVDLARLMVPVEWVTEPFDPAHLPDVDTVISALREAGAIGSRQGLLLGFGVHLNVEIAEPSAGHLWRTVTAYALLESALRKSVAVDLSRRVLPFVQPYSPELVDALAEGCGDGLEALIETYLTHAPTRNHGLDMLPVFAHLAPKRLEGRLADGTATKPRPAYHFRMPDCRIDEPGWSILEPWFMWHAVERLAAAPHLFDRLRQARRDWRARPALQRGRWDAEVERILDAPHEEAAE
jgi:hypothetical protein